MYRVTIIMFFLFFLSLQARGQTDPDGYEFEVEIFEIDEDIKIDGRLDEGAWGRAKKVTGFIQQFPDEGDPPAEETEVKIMYDQRNLYIGARIHDTTESPHIISSLQRDYDFFENDAFGVLLGPYDDGANGFFFAVNPLNIQLEALVTNGDNLQEVWDNRWTSAVQVYDDYWEVEIAIPFKTLRFNEGTDYWRINFIRNDRKNFQASSWTPAPIHQNLINLAFTGYMLWENPLRSRGPNISVIPYVAGNTMKNHEAGTPSEQGAAAGLDAKIAVTPALNLDLTLNPDFSTVEVDQQQTNLDRFEIYFPERRQFFLENADLFSDFGFTSIRPFFSRRIGIATDSLGRTTENRIIGGARLNGKIGDNFRLGLLNMQTAREEGVGFPGQNFTVATFQQKMFSRSNIAGIFVNRETTSRQEGGTSLPDYNRLIGLDYNLASPNDRWNGIFFVHKTFSPHLSGDDYSHASYLRYNTRRFEITWNHEYVGENFNAEVGYVPRVGYWRLEPSAEFRIYPLGTAAQVHKFKVYYDLYKDSNFGLKTDERFTFNYRMEFRNTAYLNFRLYNEFIYLFFPFDPTRTDGEQLSEGTTHQYTRAGVTYVSDVRKRLNFYASTYYGGFYNGTRAYFRNEIIYRAQPYGSVSLFAEFNSINLPEPYNSADLWLVGPRFEISFTDELFLSTFIQYNNQINNINLNTRFQWRFKPVSDLFIVYRDDYFPNLQVKNRSVVLKLTYWLNL
ncbi:carbohydrate binding family 9 domain-containing protein [Litoribacter ruber]|nr:DUF5916 domain-containing protein [Litoribacter alkaliphilus]